MSEQTPDIGRIVSLIMENPKLIEEISNMAKGERGESAETNIKESAKASAEAEGAVAETVAEITPRQRSPHGRNRSQLLGALKSYVSKERAQAIDSMLSIVEILDAMTGRK